MRRSLCLLPLCSLALLGCPAGAGAATQPCAYGPPSAHIATIFRTSICSNDAVFVQKYNEFVLAVREYHLDVLMAGETVGSAISSLGVADVACRNHDKPTAAAKADAAKAQVEEARSQLHSVALDYDKLYRLRDFSNNRQVRAGIEAALKPVNARLRQLVDVLNDLEQGADEYTAGNCDGGANLVYNAEVDNYVAFTKLQRAEVDIALAVGRLFGNCKNTAQSVDPMSPGQVGGRVGGGGTQTRSSQDYSVLAPKRLKANTHGRTGLPLTLSTPTNGLLEISVNQGRKLLIDIHGTLDGRGGVIVQLPKGIAMGTDQLTVRFWKGPVAPPAVTMKLSFKVV